MAPKKLSRNEFGGRRGSDDFSGQRSDDFGRRSSDDFGRRSSDDFGRRKAQRPRSVSPTLPQRARSASPAPLPRRNSNATASRDTLPPSVARRNSTSTTSRSLNDTIDMLRESEELKKKFKGLDSDGDGTLTFVDLLQLFRQGDPNITEKDARILFDGADLNKNGRIEFDEFVDYIYSSAREMEVELPVGGGGLILGGKRGNAVVKRGFVPKVRVGWRAVAMNGSRMEPEAFPENFAKASASRQKFTLTFEVDEKTMSSMLDREEPTTPSTDMRPVDRREAARRELLELLHCRDVSDLDSQTEEERNAVLHDQRLSELLVEAHAVSEAQVLFGDGSGADELAHEKLVEALLDEDPAVSEAAIKGIDVASCFKRDGDGNLPLHLVRTQFSASQLVALAPQARMERNLDGRNPLNEQLTRNPEGLAPSMLESMLAGDEAFARACLLTCDEDGICAAMRLEGRALEEAGKLLPCWKQLLGVLNREAASIEPALEELAGEEWPGLLAFHCYADVLRERKHTTRSWERLGSIWEVLARLLRGCKLRQLPALDVAKLLLKATKGPNVQCIDMRLPYRQALTDMLAEIGRASGDQLAKEYLALDGDAACWLTKELVDGLNPELVPDAFASRGLLPRLRMDFVMKEGLRASPAMTPEWATSKTPHSKHVYDDLLRLSVLGNVRKKDAAYDMLRLSGMGNVQDFSENQSSLWLARCYAAYLRGVCQNEQDMITRAVQESVGYTMIPGETLFARKEAKQIPRIIEKMLQRIEEINFELSEAAIDLGEDAKVLLRQSAAFICDINGVTLVAESPEQLKELYDKLRQSFVVLRVKNTYLAKAVVDAYRDVKLFLAIETEVGHVIVEVQLILRGGYEEKRWMHLPYVFDRGDMDWHHIRSLRSVDQVFQDGWRLYHGIRGTRSESDLKEANKYLTQAAKQGHIVARGLCHAEGWGGLDRDPHKARECFEVATDSIDGQSGRREGMCRMGMSLLASVKDITAHRRRGLALLREAAREGEPEAYYQLYAHEHDFREKKQFLEDAVILGHKKAANQLPETRDRIRGL